MVLEKQLRVTWNCCRSGDVVVDQNRRVHVFAGFPGPSYYHNILNGDNWQTGPPMPLVRVSESSSATQLKDGTFAITTSGGWELHLTASNGIALPQITTDDYNFSQIEGDKQANLAYIISTPRATKRTELRMLDFNKPKTEMIVAGPIKIAEGSGIQKDTDREHPSIAADPNGGAWVAYSDNRDGTWRVYIRKIVPVGYSTDIKSVQSVQKNRISAYPNPFSSCVEIWVLNSKSQIPNSNLNVGIYDVSGRLVQLIKNPNSKIHNSYTWNAENQSNGVYIIRAEVDNVQYQTKVFHRK